MKLKYTLEQVDMGSDFYMVPVGEDADKLKGVLRLNKEGKEIVQMLAQEMTEEAIVDALAAKYETDRETLARYVRGVIEKLRDSGLMAE